MRRQESNSVEHSVKAGGKRVNVQEGIDRKEVKKTIDKLKYGWNNCRNVKIWRGNNGRMDVHDM